MFVSSAVSKIEAKITIVVIVINTIVHQHHHGYRQYYAVNVAVALVCHHYYKYVEKVCVNILIKPFTKPMCTLRQ